MDNGDDDDNYGDDGDDADDDDDDVVTILTCPVQQCPVLGNHRDHACAAGPSGVGRSEPAHVEVRTFT